MRSPKKKDLDKNMVRLVRALNAFQGVTTIGSCGGHPNPRGCQRSEGAFYVNFTLSWDQQGQLALEFLAWLVNNFLRGRIEGMIVLIPFAPPPYLNGPGTCLHFTIEGRDGADPEELATHMDDARREFFEPSLEEDSEEIFQEGKLFVIAFGKSYAETVLECLKSGTSISPPDESKWDAFAMMCLAGMLESRIFPRGQGQHQICGIGKDVISFSKSYAQTVLECLNSGTAIPPPDESGWNGVATTNLAGILYAVVICEEPCSHQAYKEIQEKMDFIGTIFFEVASGSYDARHGQEVTARVCS
jgi:hypothetical protein